MSTFSDTRHVQRWLHMPFALVFLYCFVWVLLHPYRSRSGKPDSEPLSLPTAYTSQFTLKEWLLMYLFAVFSGFCVLFLYENIRAMFHASPRRLSLTNDYINGNPPKVDKMKAFEYDTPMNAYEWAKVIFFMVTGIAVLRVLTVIVFVWCGLACMSLAGDRRQNRIRFAFWTTMTNFFVAIVLAAIGIYHVHTYGSFAKRSECRLLLGNHSCVIEVLLLFIFGDYPAFVSRKQNLKVAFFGKIAKASDCIIVDRDAETSRKQTLDAIVSRAKDPDGSQLMIFPEGTTTNQQTLFLFKRGAFEPGAPVQMICICFPYKHFNPSWMGRGVGGSDLWDIMVRLCCQFFNYVEIRPLPVYYPTEEEKADPVLYAAHCQRMMATVLRENISDATLHDYAEAERLYKEQREHEKQ